MVHVDGSEEPAEERPLGEADHTAPRHANDFAVGNSYAVVAVDLVIVFSLQNLPTHDGPGYTSRHAWTFRAVFQLAGASLQLDAVQLEVG